MLDFYSINTPTSFSYLYHAVINSDIEQFNKYLKQCQREFQIGKYDANYTIPVIFRALMDYNKSQEANIIINVFIQYAKMNDLYDNKDYIFEGKTVKEYEDYVKNILL
ncbi:hypothetical protein Klosneuvirus_6_59 [Klosneuvirus KNV1]|uniref:Uncharacterized protein n=1 Tax=Klosneuvirus KNV1 TaxID=1977640 RepID=A0A1V0SL89_9VIRU|nr:hypothetical protein Klosneuvirus_6_59 [Klosneuvirus KNV1]